MSDKSMPVSYGVLVEEGMQFTLVELSRACNADVDQLLMLIDEGVLMPSGDDPQAWRFGGTALQRARTGVRLMRDLELNASGTALVLDLLEQIQALRSQLRRRSGR
jgi:chaperone modulatory protein CbpM